MARYTTDVLVFVVLGALLITGGCGREADVSEAGGEATGEISTGPEANAPRDAEVVASQEEPRERVRDGAEKRPSKADDAEESAESGPEMADAAGSRPATQKASSGVAGSSGSERRQGKQSASPVGKSGGPGPSAPVPSEPSVASSAGGDRGETERRRGGRGGGVRRGPSGRGGPGGQMFERADADGDGKLSREEVPEAMRDRMFEADADGDGLLTRQELAGTQRGPMGGRGGLIERFDTSGDGKLSREEVPDAMRDRMFEGDADGDGLLTRAELAGMWRRRVRGPGPMFQRLDTNSDRKLSRDEIPEPMRDRMSELDADGDGQIDEEEFGEWGRRRGRGRPGGQRE